MKKITSHEFLKGIFWIISFLLKQELNQIFPGRTWPKSTLTLRKDCVIAIDNVFILCGTSIDSYAIPYQQNINKKIDNQSVAHTFLFKHITGHRETPTVQQQHTHPQTKNRRFTGKAFFRTLLMRLIVALNSSGATLDCNPDGNSVLKRLLSPNLEKKVCVRMISLFTFPPARKQKEKKTSSMIQVYWLLLTPWNSRFRE